MKKWMSAVCVLMAVLFITGCGKDKSFNPSVSSLYIEKNDKDHGRKYRSQRQRDVSEAALCGCGYVQTL